MANHSWIYAFSKAPRGPYQGPFKCWRCGAITDTMNSQDCPVQDALDDVTGADLLRQVTGMKAEIERLKAQDQAGTAAPDPRPKPLGARRFATEAEGDAYTHGWFEALDSRLKESRCTSYVEPATVNDIRPGLAWCDRHSAGHAPPDATGIRLAALEDWQKTVNSRLRDDPHCEFNHKNLTARIEQLYEIVGRLQDSANNRRVVRPECVAPGCAEVAVKWNKTGAWCAEHQADTAYCQICGDPAVGEAKSNDLIVGRCAKHAEPPIDNLIHAVKGGCDSGPRKSVFLDEIDCAVCLHKAAVYFRDRKAPERKELAFMAANAALLAAMEAVTPQVDSDGILGQARHRIDAISADDIAAGVLATIDTKDVPV